MTFPLSAWLHSSRNKHLELTLVSVCILWLQHVSWSRASYPLIFSFHIWTLLRQSSTNIKSVISFMPTSSRSAWAYLSTICHWHVKYFSIVSVTSARGAHHVDSSSMLPKLNSSGLPYAKHWRNWFWPDPGYWHQGHLPRKIWTRSLHSPWQWVDDKDSYHESRHIFFKDTFWVKSAVCFNEHNRHSSKTNPCKHTFVAFIFQFGEFNIYF